LIIERQTPTSEARGRKTAYPSRISATIVVLQLPDM
jgi:hypothetical protein